MASFFWPDQQDQNEPVSPSQLEARQKIAMAMLGRRQQAAPKNVGEGLNSIGGNFADYMMMRQLNQLADRAGASERAQFGAIPPRTPAAMAAPPAAPAVPRAAVPPPAMLRPTPVQPVRVPSPSTNTMPGAIPPAAVTGGFSEATPQEGGDRTETADITEPDADPDDTATTAAASAADRSDTLDSIAALLAGGSPTSFTDASEPAGAPMPSTPAVADQTAAPSLEGLSGGFLAAPAPAGGGAVAGNMGRMRGVNPQLVDVVQAGARTLPEGYTVQPTSGVRPGDRGYHGSGRASDWQILDPQGNAIPNTGDDPTGLYRQLARGASAYARETYPDMPLAWGGAFDKRKGGGTGVPDLMHFDLGGDRGNLRPENRLAALTAAGTMTDIPSAPQGGVQMAQGLSPSMFSPAPMNPRTMTPQIPSAPQTQTAPDLNLPPQYKMEKPVPPPIPQERPMSQREMAAWNAVQNPGTFPAVKEGAKNILIEEKAARDHLYSRDVEAYKAGMQNYNTRITEWEKQQAGERPAAIKERGDLQEQALKAQGLITPQPAPTPLRPGQAPGLPGQPPPDDPGWRDGRRPPLPPAPAGYPADKYIEKVAGLALEKFDRGRDAIPHFQPVLELIDQLSNHKGLSAGTGFLGRPAAAIEGTEAHNFVLLNQRATGEAFLQAYEKLHGTGSIATKEGQEGKAAIATLMTSQSPEAYRKNLVAFEGLVRRQMAQAQLDARVPVTAWHVKDADPQYAPNPGTISVGRDGVRRQYLGPNIGDPADIARAWRPI